MEKRFVLLFRIALAAAVLVISHLATTARAYPVVEDLNDKVSHILAFAALGFLSDFSFPGTKFVPVTALSLMGYGLLIEAVQYFLPYRTASLLDWAADAAGLAVYLLAVPILKRIPLLNRRWHEKR